MYPYEARIHAIGLYVRLGERGDADEKFDR